MAFDNTNRGAIWPNDKEGVETRPDFRGSVNIEGVEYWVSAWKRKEGAKAKSPSLTFNVEKKEDKYQPKPEQQSKDTGKWDDFDDDIPF